MQIERELLKGALPLAVMRLLERREMYGYELITELAQQSDGVLKLGQSTLYPLLYNLEAQGLIVGRWGESDSGRRRKYYSLTEDGHKRLSRDQSQWQRLVHGLGQLLTEPRPASFAVQ